MQIEIEPLYEVLFNDLKSHLIGEYLISRDFKILMAKNDNYSIWQKKYEEVKHERSYFSVGYNHEKGDNLSTLIIFLNSSHIERIEKIITNIICGFIDFKKNEENFTDVIEAMNIAKFNKNFISSVEESFISHKEKRLPKKEILGTKRNEIKKNKLPNKREIFIVHGHNEELKQKVARTIEKLNLIPIILHEQSNRGLTIIEKFEKHSDVGFSIVLLTFDDYGYSKSKQDPNKRPRQNVILELGFFIGKLGRHNVMPLYENDVELPNDMSGIIYTLIDSNDNWKFALVKELKAAGYDVDANNIL